MARALWLRKRVSDMTCALAFRTRTHTHQRSLWCWCLRGRWVENINWRQSVLRLEGLDGVWARKAGFPLRKCCSSPPLRKQWKRDPKKMSPTHYFHCKHTHTHTHTHARPCRFLFFFRPFFLSLLLSLPGQRVWRERDVCLFFGSGCRGRVILPNPTLTLGLTFMTQEAKCRLLWVTAWGLSRGQGEAHSRIHRLWV